jgi:aminopeptidase
VDADTVARLADLAVGFGASVQPGQSVYVRAQVGQHELARAVADSAYRAGAHYVSVSYDDPHVQLARLEYGTDDALGYEPDWIVRMIREAGDEHAAVIGLAGPVAPGLLDGADPARVGRDRPPGAAEMQRNLTEALTSWTIIPCPSPGWAALVRPDAVPGEALEALWRDMVRVCRLDEPDPEQAWRDRVAELGRAKEALNALRLDAVHLHGAGTDLRVGLLPSSQWHGGALETSWGRVHHPNLPTEEVFTTPDPTRVDGVARATRPREIDGTMISGFTLQFESGRLTGLGDGPNVAVLDAYARRDDGASRLGELALVDATSRVGALGRVFYDTLIDENAASHVALGQGFAWAAGAEDAGRINQSEIHLDLMIGSAEVDVDGITADGGVVPLLRAGEWQML